MFSFVDKKHRLRLSIYYTALSTSTWRVEGMLVHQLTMKRKVAESLVVDYNPFMLEAMESNMELRLIVHTPIKVVEYITKEQNVAFGIKKSVEHLLRHEEDPSIHNVLRLINDARHLSLPEAFYRVDNSLYLSETNLTSFAVDADLPSKRRLHLIPDTNGRVFEGLPGRFREVVDLFSNYVHANR